MKRFLNYEISSLLFIMVYDSYIVEPYWPCSSTYSCKIAWHSWWQKKQRQQKKNVIWTYSYCGSVIHIFIPDVFDMQFYKLTIFNGVDMFALENLCFLWWKCWQWNVVQTIATTSNKLFKMSTKLICCLCNVHLDYMDNFLENCC